MALCKHPYRDGCKGADEEGPYEGAIGCGFSEEAGGADDAPEDAAVEVDAGDRTGEAVEGLWGADVGDVGEHPVEDGDLGEGGDYCGKELNVEEEAGGDFHVVSEFEVGGEFHALGGGYLGEYALVDLQKSGERSQAYVAVGYEYHVCHGSAGEERTAGKLAD